jgi:hypothetical protein
MWDKKEMAAILPLIMEQRNKLSGGQEGLKSDIIAVTAVSSELKMGTSAVSTGQERNEC